MSLSIIIENARRTSSNGRTLSTLWSQYMISLDYISWHPRCALKLRDPNWIEYIFMWVNRENPDLSWVLFYKHHMDQPLPDNTPKMDRKLSDQHRSAPIPGKTRSGHKIIIFI